MRRLIEWLKRKRTESNSTQDAMKSQPGVNMNGSMFLHYIEKIEFNYRTRQASDTATATMTVTDAEGHDFTINFFSPGGEHIAVEIHDHNEK